MTEVCKVLDYPEDIDRLLENLSYEQQTDWELVNNLQVEYSKFSKTPLRMFCMDGDREVEIYFNEYYSVEVECELIDEVLTMVEKLGLDGKMVK